MRTRRWAGPLLARRAQRNRGREPGWVITTVHDRGSESLLRSELGHPRQPFKSPVLAISGPSQGRVRTSALPPKPDIAGALGGRLEMTQFGHFRGLSISAESGPYRSNTLGPIGLPPLPFAWRPQVRLSLVKAFQINLIELDSFLPFSWPRYSQNADRVARLLVSS